MYIDRYDIRRHVCTTYASAGGHTGGSRSVFETRRRPTDNSRSMVSSLLAAAILGNLSTLQVLPMPVHLRGDEGEGRAVSSTSDRIWPRGNNRKFGTWQFVRGIFNLAEDTRGRSRSTAQPSTAIRSEIFRIRGRSTCRTR